jgi:uncharacterized protein YegP (UPF0339 family)
MEFEIYQDTKREWRWTLKGKNGEPLAVSSEGYKNKFDCMAAMELFREGAPSASIEHRGAKK